MNRNQLVAFAIAAANLLVILLFPPYDTYSVASAKMPIFAGFYFYFSPPQYAHLNSSVLSLEIFVILANLAIACLLLRTRAPGTPRSKLTLQNATLVFTGMNLVVVLLFPPFESVFALTNAMIPTFEGFYFIFDRKPVHIIVTTLLYLEVAFVLANGAILWLIFKERKRPSEAEVAALAAHLGLRKVK